MDRYEIKVDLELELVLVSPRFIVIDLHLTIRSISFTSRLTPGIGTVVMLDWAQH